MTNDIHDIRQFWNDQAMAHGSSPQATTPDVGLRQIEISSISDILGDLTAPSRVLDIGWGNGYSLLRLAATHVRHQFVGGDYAAAMVAQARAALEDAPRLHGRVRFEEMDVLSLPPRESFDVVISDRCLINLPNFAYQQQAVDQIHQALHAGGRYVAIENFEGGHAGMNQERLRLGLQPLPVRWHNCYLNEHSFIDYCSQSFDVHEILAISSTYYLLTRVVYAKLCQDAGIQPGYDHPIYGIAARLPILGDFGPVKMVVMVKR